MAPPNQKWLRHKILLEFEMHRTDDSIKHNKIVFHLQRGAGLSCNSSSTEEVPAQNSQGHDSAFQKTAATLQGPTVYPKIGLI